MTFIKLDEENFVNTKIVNRFKVEYKNSDESTFLYDDNIDSKSIIYNNPNTFGTFSNSLLGLQENSSLNENISSFFDFASNLVDHTNTEDQIRNNRNEYFNKKDELNTLSVTNENLKKFNFKNAFKINRTVNKFLPSSFEMSKFESINNNLYEYYKKDFSKDFYTEVDYGFCNYNTINFFSQKYNSERVHSNCLVYSNQKNASGVNDVDFSNDFSINLWINIRKNNNSNRGCIIHIPDVFSVYSVEEASGSRICVVTGSEAKKTLNTQNFNAIDFNSTDTQISDNICLFESNILSYNNWHNITLNFNNLSQNEYSVTLYNDGNIIKSFSIEITREKQESFDSFICLGNKPYYFRDASNTYNTKYDDIFYTFFGKNQLLDDNLEFDGPFFKKDLNLGLTNYNDNKQIDDIITNNNLIYFNDSIEKNSSFHGEIHEIKIYSESLSIEKIQDLYKNSIKDIDKEKQDYGLSFFVPVYYLPLTIKKVGLFNCSKSDVNLHYNCLYNPYFANSSLGRDLSIENYLVEFIKSKKPNVVISGFNNQNIYSNFYESLHKEFFDNSTDFLNIKKGKGSDEIFLENLESLPLDNDNKYNNISYRNLLIVPNDNGIPNTFFNSIDYFLTNNTVYNAERDFFNIDQQEKLYHIDCYNTLKYVQYQVNDRLDGIREGTAGRDITLRIENNSESKTIKTTKDKLFDISNFFYHDDSITKVSDLNVLNDLIPNQIRVYLDYFNSAFIDTESNPINRNYISDTINFRSNESILNEDLNYKFLPVPYFSINKNDLSLFSQIIDISTQYYNKKIKKGTINLKDTKIFGTNNIEIKISDNSKGHLFRNDCLTKVADWNYIGHTFYKEGILAIHHPSLYTFGKNDFDIDFDTCMRVAEQFLV